MKDPFFSFVIPTFNRSKSLELLLRNIYGQSFKNFEIIIQDNNSSDGTSELVNKYVARKSNIIYHKNDKNIGAARNLYKGILKAKGKYIFLMGDDDLILKKDTLKNIHDKIFNGKIGFIRLRYVYKGNYLFTYFENKDSHDIYFQKNSQNLDIYNFLYKYFQFMSGVIFKNEKNKRIQMLEKKYNPLYIDSFYIHYLFRLTKKYGALVMNQEIIIAEWSPKKNNTHYYDFIDGRAYFEEMWKFIKPSLSDQEMNIWKMREIKSNLNNLPSVKYYSNNKNLILTFRRILMLDKSLRNKFSTYFIFIFALFCPKILWETLRSIIYRINKVRDRSIILKYDELVKEQENFQ